MSPEATMARHARSFAPAARLLARPDRARVARLYVLCRTIDDIADEIGGDVARIELQRLHADLECSDTKSPLAAEGRALFSGWPDGLEALRQLVAAAAADTERTCIVDDKALDAYCMGVAGTVGVMICALFDVERRWHETAADLGKAMQLTNICRDVAEDARLGRRYLPYTLCPYSPEAIAAGTPEAVAAATESMAQLLDRADDLYRSGRDGLVALPIRLRLAVASAAAMYAGIGTVLRRRDYAPLQGRAVVPVDRKVGLVVVALMRETTRPLKSQGTSAHVQT
ncbi:MAG: phytoene synthase [Dinoroseobacter sp.]|jgi:phytoene synthase